MDSVKENLFNNNPSLKTHLIIIICLAIFVRIFVAYFVGHKFHPKLWEYESVAQSMLEKCEYSMPYGNGIYYAIIPPGYSFLLYSVYKAIGTNHQVILAIQFLLAGVLGSVIYGTTWLIFRNRWIALVAGILTVFHPAIIYYNSVNIHNFNLYVPLFHTIVFVFCLIFLQPKWKYFIILGILGGYAVLTRGTILPYIFFALLIYLIFNKINNMKCRIYQVLLVFGIIVLINTPWTIRNYLVFNKFIFSQTTQWETFWLGNNPEASGGQLKADGTAVHNYKPPGMQAELDASGGEIQDGEIFKKYAFKYIKEQPWKFLYGLIRKTVLFWWFYPQTGLLYPKIYLVIYKMIYSAILILTISGFILCQINKLWQPIMVFPILLTLGINAVHAIYVTEMRHRWTIEPVMLIFASVPIYYLAEKMYLKFREIT